MVGKWHLKTEPRGFDYYEVLRGQGPYYNPTMRTSEGEVNRKGHTSQVITDSALRWLREGRETGRPFAMIYNPKAPHRNWLPSPDHLGDYRDRDLPEPSSLFYDYSGLASPAKNQDMEIATTMSWGWDLKVPRHPETGEPTEGWEQLVERNDLTDQQRERIEEAYAAEKSEALRPVRPDVREREGALALPALREGLPANHSGPGRRGRPGNGLPQAGEPSGRDGRDLCRRPGIFPGREWMV